MLQDQLQLVDSIQNYELNSQPILFVFNQGQNKNKNFNDFLFNSYERDYFASI